MTETPDAPRVLTERDGAVAVVRLNRPDKKNALTSAMYRAVAEAFDAAEADDGVAVHLLLGVPGAFSAGNDIEDFVAATASGGLGDDVLRFLKTLARLDKPLIIGVDGLAIGVGTTALLHADLVYASDRSLFKTPFLDLGVVPEAASSLLAPRLMGHAAAFELLCLGAGFDASRAAVCGLVNRVVSADVLEATAREAAAALARKPREALRLARRLLRAAPGIGRDDVLARIDAEAAIFSERLASPEAQAAFAAFLGRRR